jgi:hypothetical protein
VPWCQTSLNFAEQAPVPLFRRLCGSVLAAVTQCESIADSLLNSLYPDVLILTPLDALNHHLWSCNVP